MFPVEIYPQLMWLFPDKSFHLIHDVVVVEVVHTTHKGVAEIVNGAVDVLVLHDITPKAVQWYDESRAVKIRFKQQMSPAG
jgi:hypothetical protein